MERSYEVKVILRDDLIEEESLFASSKIIEYANLFDMYLHEDGVTYSKREPYKKYEDIPAGVKFYFKLKKIEDCFSLLEFYSYAEGDYNGKLKRNNRQLCF